MLIPKHVTDILWTNFYDTNNEKDVEAIKKELEKYKNLKKNSNSDSGTNLHQEEIAYLQHIVEVMDNPSEYKANVYVPTDW